MTENNVPLRRRRVVFGSRFQLHVLGAWVLLSAAFAFVVFLLVYFACRFLRTAQVHELFLRDLQVLLAALGLFTILVGFSVGLYTLLLSHRVLGPVKRLAHTLREIREGRYPSRLNLRRGDFLQELAEEIGALSEQCQQRDPSPRAIPAPPSVSPDLHQERT